MRYILLKEGFETKAGDYIGSVEAEDVATALLHFRTEGKKLWGTMLVACVVEGATSMLKYDEWINTKPDEQLAHRS